MLLLLFCRRCVVVVVFVVAVLLLLVSLLAVFSIATVINAPAFAYGSPPLLSQEAGASAKRLSACFNSRTVLDIRLCL